MSYTIKLKPKPGNQSAICILGSDLSKTTSIPFTIETQNALSKEVAEWESFKEHSEKGKTYFLIPEPKNYKNQAEYYRKAGSGLWERLKQKNINEIFFSSSNGEIISNTAEGLILRDYRFEKYKAKPAVFKLKTIEIQEKSLSKNEIQELDAKLKGIELARDLVNEPANILTASEMASRFKKAGEEAGFKVTVFKKSKLENLKMGGLLSVNQGSTEEPTFSILEYTPTNAVNQHPVVFVGKGIVYDTGGLSLKPTPNSMDIMKCDMGGAAAVVGTIYAIAKAKLSIKVIGLIPATDNQPGPDAYKPGDVIKMYNGLNVEVMNTDAEGRLVMADALAYAEKYKPDLTIDLATLTGSSMRAIGNYAGAAMGTADGEIIGKLKKAGFDSWERIVEFPLWDDYDSDLKSDIADTRNLGPTPFADVIIAGKFLEKFTNYPWIHIDIAGPAFLPAQRGYLPKGGTGFGVHLLYHFLKNLY